MMIAGLGYWIFGILFPALLESDVVATLANTMTVSTQVITDYGNALGSKLTQRWK